MDQLLKFELNPTVNESGKSSLLKLRETEKNVVAQRETYTKTIRKSAFSAPKTCFKTSQHSKVSPKLPNIPISFYLTFKTIYTSKVIL